MCNSLRYVRACYSPVDHVDPISKRKRTHTHTHTHTESDTQATHSSHRLTYTHTDISTHRINTFPPYYPPLSLLTLWHLTFVKLQYFHGTLLLMFSSQLL